MVITEKGPFIKGLCLFVTFLIVLAIMIWAHLFNGQNALTAADDLFNSISKGSTNYIPGLLKKNQANKGTAIEVDIKLKSEELTQQVTKILTLAGAEVKATDKQALMVKGDMGGILDAALKDSESMFQNRDGDLSAKYGFGGREALYAWWNAFKEFDKSLKRQKRFAEAKFVEEVVKRGVEVGYNFFKIEPQTAVSKAGVLTFSLVFYVIYTLWWGVAILFLFEGVGMQMKKGAKKEV
jgi:hypothetical protein